MVGGIVPIFGPWKKRIPMTRLVVHKAAKVLFNATIHDLGLAVALGMIGGCHA